MKKVGVVWLVFVLVFSFGVVALPVGDNNVIESKPVNDSKYTPRAPIVINNDNWASYGFPGSGTAADPWIIEGYEIDGTGFDASIGISESDDFFIIQDSYLHSANNGIKVEGRRWPIGTAKIMNNVIESNTVNGIYLWESSDIEIKDNRILNNNNGIYILGDTESDNVIHDNEIKQNTGYGIYMGPFSFWNDVFHNNFIANGIQAEDNGRYDPLIPGQWEYNSWDNGYPSGGNYWDDFTGPDVFSGPNQDQPGADGIIDTPRPIPGTVGLQDEYPLSNPLNLQLAGPVHNIDTDERFLTIQEAIDDPDTLNGHTIDISFQNYTEDVNVTKQLKFIGGAILAGNFSVMNNGNLTLQNFTLLIDNPVNGTYNIFVNPGSALIIMDEDDNSTTKDDGSYIAPANEDGNHRFYFWVKAGSNFTMKNSELKQSGYYPNQYEYGLFVETDNAIIEGNEISEGHVGIFFYGSEYSTATNNYIHNTTARSDIFAGNAGILSRNSNNLTISQNKIYYNQRYGVKIQWSLNNTIEDIVNRIYFL